MERFEKKTDPLISGKAFQQRMVRRLFYALTVIVDSLILGVFGYVFLEGMRWEQALLNAATLLSGLGCPKCRRNRDRNCLPAPMLCSADLSSLLYRGSLSSQFYTECCIIFIGKNSYPHASQGAIHQRP